MAKASELITQIAAEVTAMELRNADLQKSLDEANASITTLKAEVDRLSQPARPADTFVLGVVGGVNDSPATVIATCQALGMKAFRIWKSPLEYFSSAEINLMRTLKAAGIMIIVTLQPPEFVDDAKKIRFELKKFDVRLWVKSTRVILEECVDILVAGNEWCFAMYRPADLPGDAWHADYVNLYQRRLRATLPKRVKLASVPIANNDTPSQYMAQYSKLRDAGAFNPGEVDYVDIHPYTWERNIAQTLEAVAELNLTVDVPLISTEWNIVTRADHKEWKSAFPVYYQKSKPQFAILCIYRFDIERDGQKGLFKADGTKSEFYSTYEAVLKS